MKILHIFHRSWPYGGSVTFFRAIKKYSQFIHEPFFAERHLPDIDDYEEMRKEFDRTLPDIARKKPDLIHAHFSYPAYRLMEAGFPTILLSHCMVSEEYRFAAFDGATENEYRRQREAYVSCRHDEEAMYRRIKNILVLSKFHQHEIESIGGEATCISPPLDFSFFPPREREYQFDELFSLVFLARPTYIKGLHVFREASYQLRGMKFRLVLAGDYKREGNEVYYSPAVGVHAGQQIGLDMPPWVQVETVGRIPYSEIYRIYQMADATLCPSLYEALGYVNLESLASGKPVIGSHVGGIPEIVTDGETGLLFEPGNPKELSEKIRMLVDDRSRCKSMGDRGRETIKRFDAVQVVSALDQLYKRVADGELL